MKHIIDDISGVINKIENLDEDVYKKIRRMECEGKILMKSTSNGHPKVYKPSKKVKEII